MCPPRRGVQPTHTHTHNVRWVVCRSDTCFGNFHREVLEGGAGSGTKNFVYQKWPNQIFPPVNFVCSHDGPCGLEGGGGVIPFLLRCTPF